MEKENDLYDTVKFIMDVENSINIVNYDTPRKLLQLIYDRSTVAIAYRACKNEDQLSALKEMWLKYNLEIRLLLGV